MMEKQYYIVIDEKREGPFTLAQLSQFHITPQTLVWTAGMPDWMPASSLPELAGLIREESAFGQYAQAQDVELVNPGPQSYAGPQHAGMPPKWGQSGGRNQESFYGPGRTNWKTLSIIATIAGFIFSCVGGIIGAIAIYQASQAEQAYMYGDEYRSQSALSNCKTLTIISFVLTGIGLLANVAMLFYMPLFLKGIPGL